MVKKSILSKDKLLKRGWSGSKMCVFCGHDENIEHYSSNALLLG